MGTIALPIPTMDWHNAGHPSGVMATGQPDVCPFCVKPNLPTPEPPPPLVIGPFEFDFDPDGDDPGEGWLTLKARDRSPVTLQATREEWDSFAAALTL